MKIFRKLVLPHGCVATIGNFDGVHLGHRHILTSLKQQAVKMKLPLCVISFEPLPAEFFMDKPPARIYNLRDKAQWLKQLGVDYFLCQRFNQNYAAQSAESFIEDYLQQQLNVRYLMVGDDFKFGNQRKGDFQLLTSMGSLFNMQVVDTDTVKIDNHRVSSTRIRKALAAGDLDTANTLLGENYKLSGRVRHGDKRGRTIGFPTLNLKLLKHCAAAHGVYAVKITGLDKTTRHGVANIGDRPTVAGKENRLETHVFDYNGNAYGKHVCIEPVKYLRPEQHFESFEALKQQIETDAQQARQLFGLE